MKSPQTLNSAQAFRLLLSAFCLLAFCLLASCTPNPISYASTQQIDKKGWHSDEELICEVLIEDSLSLFHVDVTGRIQYTCPHDSLSLIIQVTNPLDSSFRDTLSFVVSRVNNHLWEEFRFPYCSNVRFSAPGKWLFSFRHNMSDETLKGVMAIGVYITKQ